jgi:hypothetical protein
MKLFFPPFLLLQHKEMQIVRYFDGLTPTKAEFKRGRGKEKNQIGSATKTHSKHSILIIRTIFGHHGQKITFRRSIVITEYLQSNAFWVMN